MKKKTETLPVQPLALIDSLGTKETDTRDYKETAQNRTYLSLKDAVLAGRFPPGAIVTLRKLSEMLGTSEMPVREALKRLTAEGAFEALPNRSARIPKLTRRKLLQILDLRLNLEGKATEQAAENISKRQIDELAAIHERMDKMLGARDVPAYMTLNRDFHFLIYRIADNQPLLMLIEMLWLRLAPVLGSMVQISLERPVRRFEQGYTYHDFIIKAFQDHDAAAAKRAMQSDLFTRDELPDYWDALELER